MKIGELGALAGVSAKTIRYYEGLGLLEEPARTPAGYRDYDDGAVERLRFIRDAQASGLSLAEIASVLELKAAGQRSCGHTTELLERHLGEIDEQIERLTSARASLQALAERARSLDPAACTDPNRCQVIDQSASPPRSSVTSATT
jgi:DNA-binding transcriptional MerR regulator